MRSAGVRIMRNVLAPMFFLICLAQAVSAETPSWAVPAAPSNDPGFGRNIQRAMTLMAKSTPEKRNTVRVLFYGQSITAQPWARKVEQYLKETYPNTDFVVAHLAIGGFGAERLVKTAEADLYPFYPDLMIFHVYFADPADYETIIRRTLERSTADILIVNDHVIKDAELTEETGPAKLTDRKSDAWKNYVFLPGLAAKYGLELCELRSEWKRYLRDNNLPAKALLKDAVHLNERGCYLMEELVKRNLRYRPEQGDAAWRGRVVTTVLDTAKPWVDNRLEFEFEGNRIDLISSPEASSAKDGSGNIVQNADLSKGEGKTVPGWTWETSNFKKMKPESAAAIDWGVGDLDWEKALRISIGTSDPTHLWWIQTVPAAEKTTYGVSYRLKSELSGKADYCTGSGGVAFLGKKGEWIDFKPLAGSDAAAASKWRDFVQKVDTPPGTAFVGFRFGAMSKGVAGKADLYCSRLSIVPQAASSASAKVLIDGRAPSSFPGAVVFTRTSSYPDVWWPVLMQVGSQVPLIPENWTAKIIDASDDLKSFRFEVNGSVTGPDGTGSSTERFVSKSGRVVIAPGDWHLAFARSYTKKPLPENFSVSWSAVPIFADEYKPPAAIPGAESAVTAAQGLPNGRHKLTLIASPGMPPALTALRVYRPPLIEKP
ncbi:MAG: hypothetical protein WC637_14660 [Victivallales bacterium]